MKWYTVVLEFKMNKQSRNEAWNIKEYLKNNMLEDDYRVIYYIDKIKLKSIKKIGHG